MRKKLFLALCLTAVKASACWVAPYEPADAYIYRIIENARLYDADDYGNLREYFLTSFDFRKENLRLWRQQTGTRMSDERLEKIVYGNFSREELTDFNDPQGAELFLETAKRVQLVREAMADPWYFPSHEGGDGYMSSLEDLVETCRSEAQGKFRGRYVLQGLRCLNTMRRWAEAVEFWEQQRDSMPCDIIRTMAEREAAAAYHRTGRDSIAADIYVRVGDIASLRLCLSDSDDEMVYIYEHCPDSPYFTEEIQAMLSKVDRGCLSDASDSLRVLRFMDFCQRVISERKVKDLAPWYYAHAAMLDATGRTAEAMPFIRKGTRLCKDVFLRKSFRILKMHAEAKTLPLNGSYDRRLFSDLRWLCREIDSNMNDAERERLGQLNNYYWNRNTYFWNDAMRRILLDDLCPRLLAQGRTTRALQLANFADYYMFRRLGNSPYISNWYSSGDTLWDSFSYRSDLFCMTDSLSASQLADYVRRQSSGQRSFDRFLASGSNHDVAYWYDIVGTHYLRENDYAAAVRWLQHLPKDYEHNTNIYKEDKNYLMRNPFDLSFNDPNSRRSYLDATTDYKLNFARRMVQLRHAMEHGATADVRGEAKVRYAAGMRNQWDYCWALTKYAFSIDEYTVWDEEWNAHEEEAYRRIKARCDSLLDQGFNEIQNPEIKARILHAMQRNREVIQRFPDTRTALLLRLNCDTWRDYVK